MKLINARLKGKASQKMGIFILQRGRSMNLLEQYWNHRTCIPWAYCIDKIIILFLFDKQCPGTMQ